MNIYKSAKQMSHNIAHLRDVVRTFPNATAKQVITILCLSWYLHEKRAGREAKCYLTWIFEYAQKQGFWS